MIKIKYFRLFFVLFVFISILTTGSFLAGNIFKSNPCIAGEFLNWGFPKIEVLAQTVRLGVDVCFSVEKTAAINFYKLVFDWAWSTWPEGQSPNITTSLCPDNLQIQIDDNSDFSLPLFDQMISPVDPYFIIQQLSRGITYYYRFRVASFDTWSLWANGNFIIPQIIQLFQVSSPPVELPDPIYLGWQANGADICTASGDWSGSKSIPTGSEYLNKPRGDYAFTLTCSDYYGPVSETRTTKVIQVPRCSFSADPASIILPQTSILSWSCNYADACSIDNGIGSVSNTSGSEEVRPSETTTYTLTCDGLDGTREWQATVNVGFTPKLKEIAP